MFLRPEVLQGVFIPFLGTVLGAACVFFLKGQMPRQVQRALTGFAAGVMTAASVWSLLIPAMDQAAHLGKLAFLPAFIGLWIGVLFLLWLDKLIPHLHMNSDCPEGRSCGLGKSTMLFFAVALHNLPEGMAVGVLLAGWLAGNETISSAAVLALAIGIAIQNVPEGAIISMPLKSNGMNRGKAFALGAASGAVEPVGAILTLLLSGLLAPILPYVLAFAAGCMLYVVVVELIPETQSGEKSALGPVCVALGFALMMALDVALSG